MREHLRLRLLAILIFSSSFAFANSAAAQIPPHYPGTICFTPQFWCWAQQPGPPGTACMCPSPFGFVPGNLG